LDVEGHRRSFDCLKYGERDFPNARTGRWHAICCDRELLEPKRLKPYDMIFDPAYIVVTDVEATA